MSRRLILMLTLTLAFVASLAGFAGGAAGANSTSTSAPVTSVLRVTYNPLPGTATVERLK